VSCPLKRNIDSVEHGWCLYIVKPTSSQWFSRVAAQRASNVGRVDTLPVMVNKLKNRYSSAMACDLTRILPGLFLTLSRLDLRRAKSCPKYISVKTWYLQRMKRIFCASPSIDRIWIWLVRHVPTEHYCYLPGRAPNKENSWLHVNYNSKVQTRSWPTKTKLWSCRLCSNC